jgi:hypothetical protein
MGGGDEGSAIVFTYLMVAPIPLIGDPSEKLILLI